jgi:hypothetical protein
MKQVDAGDLFHTQFTVRLPQHAGGRRNGSARPSDMPKLLVAAQQRTGFP